MIQQALEAGLTKGFKDGDGHGIAQVEASCLISHGDTDAFFPMGFQKVFGQALGFFTKEQIAILGEFRFCVAMGGFGG